MPKKEITMVNMNQFTDLKNQIGDLKFSVNKNGILCVTYDDGTIEEETETEGSDE